MASQALQTVDRGGAVAIDDSNPYRGLERSLSTRIAGLKDALPKHIDPAKFQRTVMTAAQSNPDLLTADRASLITACMKCAQDGLLPDGREAALVIYSVRQKQGSQWVSVKTVQYLPMVYGLRKKILQSGEISTLETNVVYRAEVESGAFIFEAGTEAMLRHRPMLDLSDDDITDDNIVAAYSVATMKDGSKSFEVMRRSEINKVRQASQTGALGKTKYNSNETIPPKGPWVDWFSEMARKTVMRRHSKTLPMSGDLIDMEGADEEAAARSAARLMEVEPDAPQLAPPTREEAAAGDTGINVRATNRLVAEFNAAANVSDLREPHTDWQNYAAQNLFDRGQSEDIENAWQMACKRLGANPETGEVGGEGPAESEEEIARRLDAETAAAQRGDTDDTVSASEELADEMIDRINRAEVIGTVLTVEGEFTSGARLKMEAADQDRVETAIAAAKAKFKGAGK